MPRITPKKKTRRDYSRKRYKNPNKFGKPSRRFPWKRYLLPVSSVVIIAGWVWFLAFSNTFRITDIRIEGNNRIQDWEIKDALEELMDQRYIYLIPKRSILLLSEDAIREHLLKRFVLDSVEIQKEPPHILMLTVKERVSTIFMLMPNGAQAMLDLDGSVIKTYRPEEALEISRAYGPNLNNPINPAEGLPILFIDRATPLEIRDKTVAPSVVKAVIRIPKVIEETFTTSLRSDEIHVKNFNSTTIRVRTTEGWSIYLDANQPLVKQIMNAKTVIQKKFGNNRQRLKHIDVRFGEKIFIKTK